VSRGVPVERHAAWLIDLDGTLYKPLPVKLAMAAELLLFGRVHLAAIRAFRKHHELLRENTDAQDPNPFDQQLIGAAAELNIEPESLRSIVQEWMVERPGKWIRRFRRGRLLAEITTFRASGGKTALVSDYPASSKLAALGARDLFDVVISNGEPDGPTRLKPCPDGYLAAAQKLATNPSDCLVIGDRRDADGLAASQAGMEFRLIG
jgi:FMN phosphatase YigB (HAD superfamily)